MRLVRSNDDPKLLADLERLARGGPPAASDPEPEVAGGSKTAAAAPVAAAGGAAAAVAAIDDSFVRRFVQGAVHLRRYAPFYAGGGLWLLTLLLIQPVGSGDDRTAGLAQPTGLGRAETVTASATEAAPEPDETAAPVFDSLGGSTFAGAAFDESTDTGADFGGGSTFDEPSSFSEPPAADESDDADAGSDSFDSFESFDDEEPAAPTPLAITSTGYASSTGGTPLERQPAEGGLPVTVAGGNTTRYSFFRVAGEETTLRLKETSESVNHEAAAVKICPLASGDWKAGPNQPMSAAPKIDQSALCATGTRDGEGIWTFDLAEFVPVAEGNGFGLVPGAGTASTFQVVFAPVAVTSEAPAEG